MDSADWVCIFGLCEMGSAFLDSAKWARHLWGQCANWGCASREFADRASAGRECAGWRSASRGLSSRSVAKWIRKGGRWVQVLGSGCR